MRPSMGHSTRSPMHLVNRRARRWWVSAAVAAPGLLVAARYRLEGALGSGAPRWSGWQPDPLSLWRAVDTVLARTVAVRLLDRGDGRAPALLEAARRAAGVNNPFLARVYDAGEDGDYVYVVTELLEGGSLEDLLRTGPLDADRAQRDRHRHRPRRGGRAPGRPAAPRTFPAPGPVHQHRGTPARGARRRRGSGGMDPVAAGRPARRFCRIADRRPPTRAAAR